MALLNADALAERLGEVLADIPEFYNTAYYLQTEDGKLATHRILLTYLGLADRLARLSAADLYIVRAANRLSRDSFGADYFLDKLDETYRLDMLEVLMTQADPGSDLSQIALEDLVCRLRAAQELKELRLRPSDQDPRFSYCLWGYTQIRKVSDEVLLHYSMAHLQGRLMDAYLRREGSPDLAERKDFFVNPLEDIITLERGKSLGQPNPLYKVWRTTQADGGLGWISDRKAASYKRVLNLGVALDY